MFNIKEYHRILKEYNIEENDGHLIIKADNKLKAKVARELMSALGDLRAGNDMFRLRKSPRCSCEDCVSPQCYDFTLKSEYKKSLLTKEDIIEIANDMDLNEIEEMGATEYLKKYNESLPEILRVSENDFRTIYAYMKGLK